MKKTYILLHIIFIFLCSAGLYVAYTTDIATVQEKVRQLRNVDTSLPTGVAEPKGIISTILTTIFDTQGKIKTEFLNVTPIPDGIDEEGEARNRHQVWKIATIDTTNTLATFQANYTTANISSFGAAIAFDNAEDLDNAGAFGGVDALSISSNAGAIVELRNDNGTLVYTLLTEYFSGLQVFVNSDDTLQKRNNTNNAREELTLGNPTVVESDRDDASVGTGTTRYYGARYTDDSRVIYRETGTGTGIVRSTARDTTNTGQASYTAAWANRATLNY